MAGALAGELLRCFGGSEEFLGTLLMFIPWVLALMSGFNVWALLERWLLKLAGEPSPRGNGCPAMKLWSEEVPVVEEKKPKEPRKKSPQLPPEFRKSLRVSEHQDKKPVCAA